MPNPDVGIYLSLHISGYGYSDVMFKFRLLKRVLSENLGEAGWEAEITFEIYIKNIKMSIFFAFLGSRLVNQYQKRKKKSFIQEDNFSPLFIAVNSDWKTLIL